MPLHPQAQRVLEVAEALGAPDYSTLTVEAARAAHNATIRQAGPPEDVAVVEERTIPGPHGPIRVRVYRPERDQVLPALVYFHGGGWVVGSLDAVDVPLRAVANRAACTVVSVDYRLAPEHKFPIPFDDALAAVYWVRDAGEEIAVDRRRVAVGGDSAGGTLAAAVSLSLRAAVPPVCQVLIYPVTNFGFDTGSYDEFATGYSLTRESMKWYWNHYLADPGDADDERASPLRAKDFSGTPPTFVLTAEFDPLRDEGEDLAERMRAAGVDVRLARYNGMIHGFFRMGSLIDAAYEAVDEVAEYLKRNLAST